MKRRLALSVLMTRQSYCWEAATVNIDDPSLNDLHDALMSEIAKRLREADQ